MPREAAEGPMNRPALLLVLLSIPSLALASGSYAADDTLGTSVIVAGDFQRYALHASQGDTISATLSWDASQGSAHLGIEPNHHTACSAVDIPCILDKDVDPGVVTALVCGDRATTDVTRSPPVSLSYVAPEDGDYRVIADSGVIVDHLDYHLEIQLNGEAPAVTVEPRAFLGLGGTGGLGCSV
jgi:hypothetical protein